MLRVYGGNKAAIYIFVATFFIFQFFKPCQENPRYDDFKIFGQPTLDSVSLEFTCNYVIHTIARGLN